MSFLKISGICFILVMVAFSRIATSYIIKAEKYSISMLEESSDEEEPIEEQDTSEEIESEWKDCFNESNYYQNKFRLQNSSFFYYKHNLILNNQPSYLSPILNELVPPPDNLI